MPKTTVILCIDGFYPEYLQACEAPNIKALGDKGFCMMNDSWFNEYMFEIAAPKSYLPEDLQRALDTEPILLPPWDPMGALAS